MTGKLRLLSGAAGSGKSTFVADKIAAEVALNPIGPQIFWVVPGLASYTTERLLLSRLPGTLRAQVTPLQRLAERANGNLGCVPGRPVNLMGKRLLLAWVYQASMDELSVLRRAQLTTGLMDAILGVFAEMSAFALSPEHIEGQLEVAAAKLQTSASDFRVGLSGQSLLGKLRDICLLYVRWKKALGEHHLYDFEDLPTLVEPHLRDWAEVRGAHVYIDGFDDVLPREAQFIVQLAQAAEQTTVSLEIPLQWTAAPSSTPHPESQPWLSYQRLLALATQQGLEIEITPAPRLPETGRFLASPVLARLERRLFTGGANLEEQFSPGTEGGCSRVVLASAQNLRAETDGVARAIASARLRNAAEPAAMVVLVPDLETYITALTDSFETYGIPFTMDVYPSLAQHPLSKFILASLLAITEDYSLESVQRLLKTEFCGLAASDLDWFETYLRDYEVEGRLLWRSDRPWRFQTDNGAAPGSNALSPTSPDARAEHIRRQLLQWLAPLADRLTPHMTSRELATAIWELMVATGAKRTVAQWMANETDADVEPDSEASSPSGLGPLEGSLHEQAWLKWMAILDNLVETGIDGPLDREYLLSLLFSQCTGESLTTIPAGLNQVRVMSYHHAVAWDVPRLFVLGVTDGVLPRRVSHQGLLQDDERHQFARLFGQPLGYTTAQRQGFQHWHTYRILTRCRAQLTLSAPLADSEGKALRPSLLFAQIEEWLGSGVQRQLWTRTDADWGQGRTDTGDSGEPGNGEIDGVQCGGVGGVQGGEVGGGTDRGTGHGGGASLVSGRLLEILLPRLRTGNLPAQSATTVGAVLSTLLQTETGRKVLTTGVRGLAHKTGAQPLNGVLATRLFGQTLTGSVAELETFAGCSFRHFAQYGLHLRPDELPDVTPALRGTLIHDSLQAFVEKQAANPEAWSMASDAEAAAAMAEVFALQLAQPRAGIWSRKPSRRQQADEVLVLLQRAAVVLTRHLRYGRFRPRALEVSFGDGKGDTLPALTVTLTNGRAVRLRGRIDRLDVASLAEGDVFRVLDYKSSPLDLDVTRVQYGLRLQLPVYGLAAAVSSVQWAGQDAKLGALLYLPITMDMKLSTVPVATRAAEQNQIKAMRARGWMWANQELIAAMDERNAGQLSDLFKPIYKKNGEWAKAAPVLSQGDFKALLAQVMVQVQELAEKILAGDIRISPYRLGVETPCTYCPYGALCQVDGRYDGLVFRKLQSVSQDVLERWRRNVHLVDRLFTEGGTE